MLLLATRNRGKASEIQASLEGLGLVLVTADSLPNLADPAETGTSFAENALLKAEYYHRHTGLPCLADDSGLMVDAIGGLPGVYSSRFAPTDPERIQKLMNAVKHLDPVTQRHLRRARFVCALCLYGVAETISVEGTVEGEILSQPRGFGGFGYDPVFFFPPLGKTFAELTRAEKNQVSHRAVALRLLREELVKPGRSHLRTLRLA